MLASADNPLGAIPRFNHPKEDFQTVRDVSVIFPAFNEEGNIRCTVETVIRAARLYAVKWGRIVVGGGGKDAAGGGCVVFGASFALIFRILYWRTEGGGRQA